MELNELQQQKVVNLATSGRKAWIAGDLKLAEHNFLESWEAIPEPKMKYDFSQSASYGITVFYRSTGQIAKAKTWLQVVKNAYGPDEASEEYTDFLEATILYENGEYEDAFKLFYPQYKAYGNRAFEGEEKKYLEFVKKRAKEK